MAPKSSVVKFEVSLLTAVANRLEEAVTGLHWSRDHFINDSLIRTLGLEGLGLSEDQVWGPKKKEDK